MADRRWETLWTLFDEASGQPPERRAAWLDEHCPEPGLRRELEALLRAHDREDSLLDRDPLPFGTASVEPGDRVGAWRVVRTLGVGGMGEVHLVERADGAFERRAALKVLHAGVDGADARARFERERRILASLNHPNIARLLDAGITESGRPWLLMEAVDGPTLTEWCRANASSLNRRLDLFERVCAALGHAHRRLVVHRDLKPSNIRVAADGRPRVLDFGIAKLLDAAADASVTRRADAVPLTPAYASPEQVRGDEAGTGMDIYALGALLHELLAGRAPFVGDGGRAAWLAQRRELRVRLGPDAGTLVELDWVLARALAFDPEDRYGSVDELAADVRRVREHRTPRARAVGPLYRVRKFARRNWRALAAAGAAAVLVAVLAVQLVVSAERAERARLASDVARTQAEQLSTFMTGLFELADSTRQEGAELTARDILAAGRQRLDNQPDLPAASRIDFWLALAEVHANLGDHEASRRLAGQAVQLARSTGRDDDLAQALLHLGRAHYVAGRYRDALGVYEQAATLADRGAASGPIRFDIAIATGTARQRLGDLDSAGDAFRRAAEWLAGQPGDDPARRAESELRLGSWHWASGRLGEAERRYAEALAARRAQVPVDWPAVATARMAHASALFAQGRYEKARAAFGEALSIRRRVLGEAHPDTATSLNYVGASLYELGEYAAAEPPLTEAVAIQRRTLPDESPARTGALNNLGLVQWQLGRLDAAGEAFREALDINRAALGEDHPNVANNLNNLGLLALEQAQWERALALFDEAIGIVAGARGESHPDLARPLTNRARMLLVLGRYDQAGSTLARARDLLGAVRTDHPGLVDTLTWWALGDCLAGRSGTADERLARAADIARGLDPPPTEDLARIGVTRSACTPERGAPNRLPPDSPPDLARLVARLNGD